MAASEFRASRLRDANRSAIRCLAIPVSQAPREPVNGSKLDRPRQAETKTCCVTSSASDRSWSVRRASVKISPDQRAYASARLCSLPSAKPFAISAGDGAPASLLVTAATLAAGPTGFRAPEHGPGGCRCGPGTGAGRTGGRRSEVGRTEHQPDTVRDLPVTLVDVERPRVDDRV